MGTHTFLSLSLLHTPHDATVKRLTPPPAKLTPIPSIRAVYSGWADRWGEGDCGRLSTRTRRIVSEALDTWMLAGKRSSELIGRRIDAPTAQVYDWRRGGAIPIDDVRSLHALVSRWEHDHEAPHVRRLLNVLAQRMRDAS